MTDYPISKDAEMKLHEMMLDQEIRMTIQSETATDHFSPPRREKPG
jgi:hypothetical protein